MPKQPPDLDTKAAFARRVGVSKPRISQLIARGLPVRSDGKIDVAAALAWMEGALDPAKRAEQKRSSPVVTPAVTADNEGEGEAAAAGGSGSLVAAKTEHEWLKVRRAQTALAKERGDLVDRAEAGRAMFAYARAERDAWLAWVARVAPEIAAEAGADIRLIASMLDRAVREHLAELADRPPPKILGDG